MSKNRTSIQARSRANQRLTCSVPGCGKHRQGVGRFCNTHLQTYKRTGHPLGRRLTKSELATDRKAVGKLIASHMTHPGILAALEWLAAWLTDASEGRAVPAARQDFHRLNAAGVTPLAILTEAAAIWSYYRRAGRALDDGLPLTVTLGTGILHLAPREKRSCYRNPEKMSKPVNITAKNRKDVGNVIRQTIGMLLENIAREVLAEETTQRERAIAIRTPFNNPVPLSLMITSGEVQCRNTPQNKHSN